MAEVARAYVQLVASARGITPQISKELDGPADRAGKQAGEKAGRGFKGSFLGGLKGLVGPLAGIFAGAQAIGFFKDSITAASGLNESLNALNVTYGDAAAGVAELGKKSATSLGLSNLEFNNLAVRFSSFAQTIAGDGGDVVGTLGDLTTRAADFASVMNLDVAQATQLFQSGLAGESEPLRQFGIDMSAAAVETFALQSGLIKTGEKMTEAQKVQARYGLLMQSTAQAQGDFANTSDSLANQQRILAARFEDTKARVGASLLPAMQGLTAFATGTLLPGFERVAEFFGSKVVPGFKALYDLLVGGDFTAEFARVFGVHEDSGLVAFLFNVRDAAISFGAYLRDVVVPNVQSFAATARDTLLPPLVQIGSWIGGTLIPGLVSLVGWMQQNEAWLKPIAVGILAMVAAFKLYQVAMNIARVATAAFAVVQGVLNLVMAANPIGIVILAIVGLVAALVYAWHNSETFRRIVTQAWEGIKTAASAVAAFFTKTIPALWNNIVNWTRNAWNGILAFFRSVGAKIVQFFLNWTLPGLLIRHWSSIKEGAVRGFTALVDFVRAIPGRITSALGNLGSLLYNKGRDMIQGLLDGAGSLLRNVGRFFLDKLPGWIVGPFKAAMGIASPSKVFAAFGDDMAQGLVVGMNGGRRDVAAATNRLVSVPNVGSNVNVVGSAGPGAGGGIDLSESSVRRLAAAILDGAVVVSHGVVADRSRAQRLAGVR